MIEILIGAAAIACVSCIGIYTDKKNKKAKKTAPSGSKWNGYVRIYDDASN